MPRFCFWCSVLLFGATMARPAPAAPGDWKLPPVDGELAGEFSSLQFPGAPRLQWKLSVHTTEPRVRTVDFTLEGQGTRVQGDARLDPMGEGTWRLMEAQLESSHWTTLATSFLGPEMAKLLVTGTVTASGEGTWRGGVLGGRAVLTFRDGRIDDPAHKILLEGVTLDLEIPDISRQHLEPQQVLTWLKGRYDVVDLGAGRVEFGLDGDELRVTQANITLMGGELTVGSMTMSLKRPEIAVNANLSGVDVGQLLFLLPPILSEARGRLDGRIVLRRDLKGIQIGAGRLALREGETADLRLLPASTSLSARLPAIVQKYYPGLARMEMGGIPLRAEVLEITVTPEGDEMGRTAWIRVAGGPADPNLKAPVDITINVRGPLESLVRLGTDSRLRFGERDK